MIRKIVCETIAASALAWIVGCNGAVDLAGEATIDEPAETGGRAAVSAIHSGLTLNEYAASVLADSPVAYWPLSEASGTRAVDAVGQHDGTYVNGVRLGVPGVEPGVTAASFDGVNDAMRVRDAPQLRLNGSFSIEFWARLNADANTFPGILSKGSSRSGQTGYLIYYQPGSRRPTFKRAGVDGLQTTASAALTTQQFRHYVFTFDRPSSTARWYVSGQLDRTFTSVSFPTGVDTSDLQLGRGDSFGNETLADVALYGSALSAARITAHHEASRLGATSNPFEIGLCAYLTADFARISAMGIKHVRMDRPTAAVITQARSFGLEVLPVAAYGFTDLSGSSNSKTPPLPQNYGAWAKRMVDLWRTMPNPPRVIEVWNEPWVRAFWNTGPNPAQYLELVKAFAREAWAVWPQVTLLVSADQGNADAPNFRTRLLAADTTRFLADPRILPTTHNYVENRTPTQVTSAPCSWDLDRFECAYDDFRRHGHPDPQVWVTEFGWESNTPAPGFFRFRAVTEQQQATYTVQALELFRQSGKVAAAFAFFYRTSDPWNYNFVRPNNSDKPVVGAVRDYLATP